MRLVPLISTLLAVALAGCINHVNVQCGTSSDCNEKGGGVCEAAAGSTHQWCAYPDLSCGADGYRYSSVDVGDGVSGACVAQIDAGVGDGGVNIDAAVIDARPGDIVANYQPANLVLGQEGFSTNDVNHGGPSSRSFFFADSIAVDGTTGTIWVHDANNGRVLGWSTPPTTSFASADLVVGRTNFTSTTAQTYTRSTFPADGGGIGAGGGKLLIPNSGGNRVLVYNPSPTVNGAEATLVLGQADFTTTISGAGASNLNSPGAVWTDGTRVVVADSGNNRVLVWSSFPVVNGQPASVVLGQPGFGTGSSPGTPTASSMSYPTSVASDGTRLFVTDYGSNRVLIWNSFPTVNGQPADAVLGQASFSGSSSGISSTTLNQPMGVAVAGSVLFVCDAENSRTLVYSPLPTTSGASAQFVLGQPDFVTKTPALSQNALHGPRYPAVQGSQLYVGDPNNNRVLRFGLSL